MRARGRMTKRLSFPVFMKTAFRCLFMQAAWNFENFQGVGFAYALAPFTREQGIGEAEVRDLMQRHLACFNTNPYFSGMVVGGVLRLEKERLEGRVSGEEIEALKKDLMGALGALGDSLIWGALRPLAGLAAVLTALVLESLAPVIFLVIYNSMTLWLRVAGVRNGYAYGPDLAAYLKELDFQRKIFFMNGMILFGMGALLPVWVSQVLPALNILYLGLLVLVVVLMGLVRSAERRRVPLMFQVAALLLCAQILVRMGWPAL